jgi:hypothetical protein
VKGKGKATPYSLRGISRVPCARCGAPSQQQWNICADGNRYRGMCNECDVLLNELVLDFVRDSERAVKIARYRRKMLGEVKP